MDALEKFRKKVNQIRKAHPNMAFRTAQKQASAELKKTTKPKKKVGAIKMVSGVKKKSTKAVKKTVSKSTSSYSAGLKILAKIESMEKDLKKAKGTDKKNFIKREINKMHDSLDALKK